MILRRTLSLSKWLESLLLSLLKESNFLITIQANDTQFTTVTKFGVFFFVKGLFLNVNKLFTKSRSLYISEVATVLVVC